LLCILGGLLLPSLRRLARLDRFVLLLPIALLGHRHNRGIDDLAAARNVARGLEMLAEALKQLVDQPGLHQRLAQQPDPGGISSGTGSPSSRSRKRMNDIRSRIRYSVCSSERLCSDCSTTILNFMRPALLWRSSGLVSVTASTSARKSCHRTTFLIVSSGSPL